MRIDPKELRSIPALDPQDAALKDFGARRQRLRTILIVLAGLGYVFQLWLLGPLIERLAEAVGGLGGVFVYLIYYVPFSLALMAVEGTLVDRIAAGVEREHELSPGSLQLDEFVIS